MAKSATTLPSRAALGQRARVRPVGEARDRRAETAATNNSTEGARQRGALARYGSRTRLPAAQPQEGAYCVVFAPQGLGREPPVGYTAIVRSVLLEVPPVPLLVGDDVFDAFGWNASEALEWRTPNEELTIGRLDGDLPLGLAFVFRAPWEILPAELARLHVSRAYQLRDEWALAPYAIDDATDRLFEHHRDAHATFWLAAESLNALFWGLHDWVHFHNHGAFEQRTATEFQCDVTALAWLYRNRARVPLADADWDELVAQCLAQHRQRCGSEPPSHPLDETWLSQPRRIADLAAALRASPGACKHVTGADAERVAHYASRSRWTRPNEGPTPTTEAKLTRDQR